MKRVILLLLLFTLTAVLCAVCLAWLPRGGAKRFNRL